ncbi:hypothetical protein JCM3774_002555 [Rhodotorula dairenensis]
MVGGRIRKPTARVLDSQESRMLMSSLSHERRRAVHPAASTPAAAAASTSAPVKRKGKAQNPRGKQAVARDHARVASDPLAPSTARGPLQDEHEEQDMTLYCVCLGYDTGEQPMIQCEHCSNW